MLLGFHKMAITLVGVVVVVAVGCSSETDGTPDGRALNPASETAATQGHEITPVLVNSVLIPGRNRIGVGFIGAENQVLRGLEVTALFYAEGQESSTPAGNAIPLVERVLGAESHHSGISETLPVYGNMADFPSAGRWGVTLSVKSGDREYPPIRATFEVMADSAPPAPGEPIPATRQLVLADVSDLANIDSSFEPDPALHERTIADALSTGKPLVVAFATPAFCETRFCGPVMEEVIQPLHRDYGARVEFIHVEPFDVKKARNGELVAVPAMAEWGLTTEPWVFVVNPGGSVAARFEGVVTREELESVLVTVLAR